MVKTLYPLSDKIETGREMKRLVALYSNDLDSFNVKTAEGIKKLSDLTLKEYFNFVRKIPYRQDSAPREVIARPKFLIENRNIGLDCKKKSVLMGAWFKKNGQKWRFIASSKRPDRKIHHVFPQVFDGETWKNTDATYDYYQLYQEKPDITKAEVL